MSLDDGLEIGDLRPFGEFRVIAASLMVLALPLVYARRHYRPLDRRPLFMRGLATIFIALQACQRAFVGACWVTTSGAWFVELAMATCIGAHAWQCFVVFRKSQLHSAMLRLGDRKISRSDPRRSVNAEAAQLDSAALLETHSLYRKWASTRYIFGFWLLCMGIVWPLEIAIGSRLLGSMDGVTIFSLDRRCLFPSRPNLALGATMVCLELCLFVAIGVAYGCYLGATSDQLRIKLELKILAAVWAAQITIAYILTPLEQDWRHLVWSVLIVVGDAATIWPRVYETFLRKNQPLRDDQLSAAGELSLSELEARRPSAELRRSRPIRALEMELAHAAFREQFRQYLEGELANELLLFVEKALALLNERDFGQMLLCGTTNTLYAEFIAPSARWPIMISSKHRSDFVGELIKDPESDQVYETLRALYNEIMKLLAFNHLPSFLEAFGDDSEISSSETTVDDSLMGESAFVVLARQRKQRRKKKAKRRRFSKKLC